MIDQIKQLRDATGAGVNAIREALKETEGDIEKAMSYLRQKGMAKADKRKDRTAANGILGTYIHSNNKVVVVIEVNCETDFAANSEAMNIFANEIALQVAASNPEFVSIESIPSDILEAQKETFMKELEGKPENVKEQIANGKLEKFYQEKVLLKQTLFTDDKKTVEDYLNEMVAKIGEKIVINSFAKFQVAQSPVISTLN